MNECERRAGMDLFFLNTSAWDSSKLTYEKIARAEIVAHDCNRFFAGERLCDA
jgi:hypothetical protein